MADHGGTPEKLPLDTHPDRYIHWKLDIDGPVATLAMNVQLEQAVQEADYALKLNSYDPGG